ncbi:hypothetical protein R1sor_007229 [Riccia sorocarpa]|uniref:Uncharacterized protein n=1 Tax=Riccia sorocarpa TaxID=122646 RepID=A0ABD3HQ82_9MARC
MRASERARQTAWVIATAASNSSSGFEVHNRDTSKSPIAKKPKRKKHDMEILANQIAGQTALMKQHIAKPPQTVGSSIATTTANLMATQAIPGPSGTKPTHAARGFKILHKAQIAAAPPQAAPLSSLPSGVGMGSHNLNPQHASYTSKVAAAPAKQIPTSNQFAALEEEEEDDSLETDDEEDGVTPTSDDEPKVLATEEELGVASTISHHLQAATMDSHVQEPTDMEIAKEKRKRDLAEKAQAKPTSRQNHSTEEKENGTIGLPQVARASKNQGAQVTHPVVQQTHG